MSTNLLHLKTFLVISLLLFNFALNAQTEFNSPCLSEAGTLSIALGGEYGDGNYICYGEDVVVEANEFTLMPDQAVYYVYHLDGENPTLPLQDVVTLGSFYTNDYGMRELFVTAFGATNDGAGGPDFYDPCITQSNTIKIYTLDRVRIEVSLDCANSPYNVIANYVVYGGLINFLPETEYAIIDGNNNWSIVADSIYQVNGLEIEEFNFFINDLNSCNTSFSFDLQCSLIPITVVNYYLEEVASGNLVIWKSVNELENDFYTLDRSVDGINFETIAVIEGIGTTNQPSCYTFLDVNYNKVLNIYRLSETDIDGFARIVGIIVKEREDIEQNLPCIYPIPSKKNVNLAMYSNEASSIEIQIIDISGKVWQTQNKATIAGVNNYQININDLPAGIYFMQINDDESFISERFVVE